MTDKSSRLRQLDKLRHRFDEAANSFPNLDAVVVYLPQERHIDTVRQVMQRLERANVQKHQIECRLYETMSMHKASYAAVRAANHIDQWIPPHDATISERGLQEYWTAISMGSATNSNGQNVSCALWHGSLFGPRVDDSNDSKIRLFYS